MPPTFTHEFNNASFKGKSFLETGVFIDGKFADGSDKTTIDVINPTTGKVLCEVAEATPKDVDLAVKAAQKAFDTVWGLKAPADRRGIVMNKLADLMEAHLDELAALEALDNGKPFSWAKMTDVNPAIGTIRYFAGWADKIQGKQIPSGEEKLAYTRHEPMGVVGQIIPWNFPLLMLTWKIGPALATGNTIVMKCSEFTPLTALFMCRLSVQAGFPPGVFNLLVGYGETVGAAISSHMDIQKVAFTGSTIVGRKITEAAAKSNLKSVTLELGGKSPNIIFDDCEMEQATNWATFGIFWNQGQVCCAGTRVFVHAKIYDEFLQKFTEKIKNLKVGDPFDNANYQGAQVSQQQYDVPSTVFYSEHFSIDSFCMLQRIMGYIQSGKSEGATCHIGGERHGTEGYFIQPTIFTDCKPDMKIVREEIFGPVGVVIKFDDDEDVIRQANDTTYGLASAIFSQDLNRAINTANRLHAGTVWINSINTADFRVPFGGYKQSGIGRESGEYALNNYTNIKAVHVNLGTKMI
ncbi:hypothetical protein PILCRDRAFT_749361 [Piloderma croceum F 1598]|uniref:Aldehyde dehydrogenase domain-containing protein n=1 Tax=Piloderma croceum (strain F 1598) TaxID=765440 RepID=A0A0C3EGJ5_PILCF|nr:hypothetical protein PILCRDRAFT_749361 [Piloderma croceum F 1598]